MKFEEISVWQKAEVAGKIFAAIVIPVVIGIVGNSFASASKERDTQARFVEIATEILSKEPSENSSPETRKLRTWAVSIISRYSGVTMEDDTIKALIETIALPSPPVSSTQRVSSGPWAVIFGADTTLEASRHEVTVTASKMDIGSGQIFLRNGAYRSARVFSSRADAEDALGKAKRIRADSYLVSLPQWCPSHFERAGFAECDLH